MGVIKIMYLAHKKDDGTIQAVKEHSLNTANLCKDYSVDELKQFMYMLGLLHDIGKYQPSFQRRINGENIRVEHSICGAKEIDIKNEVLSLMAKLCIAGHHSGIPDAGTLVDTKDKPTLRGRLKRVTENYDVYKTELEAFINKNQIDENKIISFVGKDCNSNEDLVSKFAFLIRYCFSCLTDADSVDTAEFMEGDKRKELKSDFKQCIEKVNKKLDSFVCETDLQKARSLIQNQVFKKVDVDSEIYLMNMPTGSGKTLCSLKFALERAIKKNKKRIIYVIPYNSIIDQTAKEFETLLGESASILRHQSTFDYEDAKDANYDNDYIKKAEIATENWDSSFIITTAAQFFESAYSNKRKKLRKLHNMADSILVFDEAHLMPIDYLKPCLECILHITKCLNSEAVFLTATMPNFHELISKYSLENSKVLDLVTDRSNFKFFKKCSFKYRGKNSIEHIVSDAQKCPSSLIIVNKRKAAKQIYDMMSGKKYHLSTYMTYKDREKTILEIKKELKNLESDFPNFENVPEDRKIRLVSTSLVEAGVDFDFHTVFREMAGLDSILQAGGRCNREGKRKKAVTNIFEIGGENYIDKQHGKLSVTLPIFDNYKDVSSKESVDHYYDQLYFLNGDRIEKNSISKFIENPLCINLKEYAEEVFKFIDQNTLAVVVNQDEESENLIQKFREKKSIKTLRKLQKYAFSVYKNELDILMSQGVIENIDGLLLLTNNDYYSDKTGISFESKDYII